MAEAQDALGGSIVKGDLEVQVDDAGDGGGLSVDGLTEVSKLPVDWPNIREELGLEVAEHYGPFRVGPRRHIVNMKFKKTATTTSDFFEDVHLGYWGSTSAAKVKVTIQVDNTTREYAEWLLVGSRHRLIKALTHKAYGDGKYISLKGSMHHSNLMLYMDCHKPTKEGSEYTIHVEIEGLADERYQMYEIFKHDLPMHALNSGNTIEPVDLVDSLIFEKSNESYGTKSDVTRNWYGTATNFTGSVQVDGSPVLTEASAAGRFVSVPANGMYRLSDSKGFSVDSNSQLSNLVEWGGIAFGRENTAIHKSLSLGVGNYTYDTAFSAGYKNHARNISAAFGHFNEVNKHAVGQYPRLSFASGYSNKVSGMSSFGFGSKNTIDADQAGAFGKSLSNTSDNAVVVGQYNVDDVDVQFAVGNGADEANRNNAFAVHKDGSVDVGSHSSDGSVPLRILADGSVILAKPQGDISMGIYGQ